MAQSSGLHYAAGQKSAKCSLFQAVLLPVHTSLCCRTSITSGQRCNKLTVVIPTGGASLALLKVNLRVSIARETTASNRANWSPTGSMELESGGLAMHGGLNALCNKVSQ